MIISDSTKYRELVPVEEFLTDDTIERLKKFAEHKYGSMYDLTFGAFLQICNGDFDILGDTQDPTVLQAYWCKRFADFQTEFGDMLKSTQVPMTVEQKRAADGLPSQTFAESMLVFLRSYFGLHSFKEAEQITLGEIVIARRDAYISAMYERKMQRIQTEKIKMKK